MTDLNVSDIQIAYPNSEKLRLAIRVNGCYLIVKLGNEVESWVSGSSSFKRPPGPTVAQLDKETLIVQEYLRSDLTNMFRVSSDSPILDLLLNPEKRFEFTVDTVGDTTSLDLGGLPLAYFRFDQKIGRGDIDFSQPTTEVLPLFEIDSQAGPLDVQNLQNARFERLTLFGNNSTYRLNWGGDFLQEGILSMETKDCPTTLTVPAGAAVIVQAQDGSPLEADSKFRVDEGFVAQDGKYWSPAALEGHAPHLTVAYDRNSPLSLQRV